jgi:hypothetical protein
MFSRHKPELRCSITRLLAQGRQRLAAMLIQNFQSHQRIDNPGAGENMSKYRVLINDNANYMDEREQVKHGDFDSADDAVAACKEIVDSDLITMRKAGTAAKDLYKVYVAFGPDPFIVPINAKDRAVKFSAWTYAKAECKRISKQSKNWTVDHRMLVASIILQW